MCLAAACWKVFWKKCLLMCCVLGASLRSTLWTHYQTDRWRLLMLIGAFDFGINCMKVSIDSESSKQSLQLTSEAEWAEKVEGKLRSGIRWLNQILLVVPFKALGNFSVWKRQRITGRELRAMLWPSTQKHGKSNTWHRVRPLFLDEFYSLINTSLLWDAGKVILGNVTP